MPETPNYRNNHAEAHALGGEPLSLASRISAMTDAELAQFAANREFTDADLAAIEEFGERVRAVSDADMEARWGIRPPELITEIRALFAASRRS